MYIKVLNTPRKQRSIYHIWCFSRYRGLKKCFDGGNLYRDVEGADSVVRCDFLRKMDRLRFRNAAVDVHNVQVSLRVIYSLTVLVLRLAIILK